MGVNTKEKEVDTGEVRIGTEEHGWGDSSGRGGGH